MILTDARLSYRLLDFGILIPVSGSKVTKILAALTEDPELGPRKAEWLVDRVDDWYTREDLERVHDPSYVGRILGTEETAELELLRTYELVAPDGTWHRYAPETAVRHLSELRELLLQRAAGTYRACRIAAEKSFCYYLGGGAHHAQRAFGTGFCLVNDVVLAARRMQAEKRAGRIWVVDTDAHKGDGTAALTAGDPGIVTLSIHMARGWPLDQPRILPDGSLNPSFVPSDIDIPVEVGEEALYNGKLREGLSRLPAFGTADLAIVVSGSDAWEGDALESTRFLGLGADQMLERDRLVYEFLAGAKVPSAWLMAGGYGEDAWRIHTQFLLPTMKRKLGIDLDIPPTRN